MSYYDMIAGYHGLRDVQNRTESHGSKLADLRRELTDVQAELRNVQLVNRAFLEVISERMGIEQEDVEVRLQELIAADRIAAPCRACKRPMSKSGGNCPYCGASPG